MIHQGLAYIITVVMVMLPFPCLADVTLELYATFHSMGVIVDIAPTDDVDRDGLVEVEYKTGTEDFRQGLPLSRISNTRFVGSLFMLQPGLQYDVRVTLFDPDGGPTDGRVIQQSLSTRAEISPSSPTNRYYTTPTGSSASCLINDPMFCMACLAIGPTR